MMKGWDDVVVFDGGPGDVGLGGYGFGRRVLGAERGECGCGYSDHRGTGRRCR